MSKRGLVSRLHPGSNGRSQHNVSLHKDSSCWKSRLLDATRGSSPRGLARLRLDRQLQVFLSVPSTARKARPGVAPVCGDPREGGGSYPPRRPSRAGRKVAGRVLQRWPCKEDEQEDVADADTPRAVRPRGAHDRRGDGGRLHGPLPQMRERRARGGIVGRGATGAVGAGAKQPPEVVGYSPPRGPLSRVGLDQRLVHVASVPVFAGLEGGDYRVAASVVLGSSRCAHP